MAAYKTVWTFWFYQFLWLGLDALFPPECGGCGKEGTCWCSACQPKISPLTEPFCEVCGSPQSANGICDKCLAPRPPYRALRSWGVFEEPTRSVLHRLKHKSDWGLGEPMVRALEGMLQPYQWPVDLIVPMPLSKQREFERGYKQAAVVVCPLAQLTGIRYSQQALKKIKETVSQVGLSTNRRRENVRDAFAAEAQPITEKTVLLVDDVATTGASVAAAAQALKQAGAQEVYVLTIARALALHDLHLV